jgi:hypothetical protein
MTREAPFPLRVFVTLGAIAYSSVLAWTLAEIIVPEFQYMGYVASPRSTAFGVALFAAAWAPMLWLSPVVSRPSQVSGWLLYLLVYIPAMLVPYFALPVEQDRLLPLALCVFSCFALLSLVPRLPVLSVPRLRLGATAFWLALGVVTCLFVAVIVLDFGLRFRLVSLESIYSVRGEFRAAQVGAGVLAPYFLSWQAKVINPFLIAYGLAAPRPLAAVVGVVVQLYLFSITGQKSIFLSPLLVAAIWIALRQRGRWFGALGVWSASGLVATCSLIAVTGSPVLGLANPLRPVSLLVRRLLATPGLLTGYYYEFFSTHPKAHLGHSILEGLVDYPYPLPPPQLIGSTYFEQIGQVPIAANANFWADGFANFGFPGMVGATLLLAAVLWILDGLAGGSRRWIACMVIAVPTYSLANTALLTAMLTHGIGLLIALIYFMPPDLERAAVIPVGRRIHSR